MQVIPYRSSYNETQEGAYTVIRSVWIAIIAVAVLAAGAVLGASTASATATSCISHHIGRVCSTVHGSGARVDRVGVTRENWNLRLYEICDYSAEISVLDGRNQARVKFYTHPSHIGCTSPASLLILSGQINRTFACGDVVSVRWYDRSGSPSGYVNKRLC